MKLVSPQHLFVRALAALLLTGTLSLALPLETATNGPETDAETYELKNINEIKNIDETNNTDEINNIDEIKNIDKINNIDIDAYADLDEILEIDPSLEFDLEGEEADAEIEEEVVYELLRRHEGDAVYYGDQGDSGIDYEGDYDRRRNRRQTGVTASGQTTRQGGVRRTTGSLGIDHTWGGRHTLSGNLGVDTVRIPGYGRSRDYTGGLRYTYNRNGRTSFNIGANRNWGSSGRSYSFGIGLSHRFGRRKRSDGERIKIKCRRNGRCKIKIRGSVTPELIRAILESL